MVKGWKTYAAAALMAGYGVGGFFLGMHGTDTMTQMVLGALAIAGLRNAIPTPTPPAA